MVQVTDQKPGIFQTKEKLLTRRGVLWLGQTCNIRCHFCYFLDRINDKEHAEHAFMELNKAKQICHDMRYKYGNSSVDIQGGEPTIWRHINELVAYCNEIGLYPTLITNAIQLSKKHKVEELKAAGIRDLLISVHALRETYDEIVGMPSGSERQLQGLDNCIEVGVPFRFNTVLSKKAIPQYEEIAHLAVAKGARAVNFLAFNPFEDQAKGGKRTTENVPRYSEVATVLNKALDILEEGGVEANVRYYPICIVEPRHRKSIYDFQQLPYDPHEWDYDSWTWTGRQPQRMKWGAPSPHHENLAAETYSSPVLQKSFVNGLKRGVYDFLAPVPVAHNAARAVYHTLRGSVAFFKSVPRSASNRPMTGILDELGRNPAIYRDHARVRALDHCQYGYAPQCSQCDVKAICDGFHGDYASMFDMSEARPITIGHKVDDPTYFIRDQLKVYEPEEAERPWSWRQSSVA